MSSPGCMFLRAGVSVNSKHKRVDIALHQVGFRSGVVDSARFIYKDKVPIHVVEAEVYPLPPLSLIRVGLAVLAKNRWEGSNFFVQFTFQAAQTGRAQQEAHS